MADRAVYDAVARTPTPELDGPVRPLSDAANYSRLWLGIAAAIALVGGGRGRRAALEGVVAIGVTSATVNLGVKPLARRRRPDRIGPDLVAGRHVPMPESASFPSGHAASAFAFAYAVGRHLPGLGLPIRLLAGGVAYSRVHTGVHYPGDVMIGSILGAATAVAPLLVSTGYRVIVPYLRGCGTTRFRFEATFRDGQQSVLAVDAVALMDALGIDRAILAGFDWGARTADVVAALWPERCRAIVSVSGYLIGNQQAGQTPLPPKAELQWWYQYYFATERGRAGYHRYRNDFAKLIWHIASPRWEFDEATFDRTARSFDNPDHVDIVIHNYRWRLGLAQGEPEYDDLERRLTEAPPVRVPAITLEGDANGAPHPDPASYAEKFTGKYAHRLIPGGVGHNLPQEAPRAFADAIVEVGGY